MEMIPIIRDNCGEAEIVSFEVRDTAHKNMMTHPTTLIIPILSDMHNKILTLNKYKRNLKKALVKGISYVGPKKSIDIFGGHITKKDLSENDMLNNQISFETIRACAWREISEELRYKDRSKNFVIQPEDLIFIGKYPYEGKNNNEISFLFALNLHGYANSYKGADDYIDAKGKKRNISLPVASRRIQEIYEKLTTTVDHSMGYEICDGLARLFGKNHADADFFVSKLAKATGIAFQFHS